MTTKAKPAHSIKLGNVKAAIWQNTGKDGTARFNATFSRPFKDGEAWKESQSFGRAELTLLAQVIQDAQVWIEGQSKAEVA